MSHTQKFTDEPEQTLYAVPSTSTPVTWAAQRVLCTEEYDGKYTVTVDETVATEWWIYIGASVPTDWNDRILEFSVPESLAVSISIALPAYVKEETDTTSQVTFYNNQTYTKPFVVLNNDLEVVDQTGVTAKFVLEDYNKEDIFVLENIAGNEEGFQVALDLGTLPEKCGQWSLREQTTDVVIVHGPAIFKYAAVKDE
jgi:hypothetical protein